MKKYLGKRVAAVFLAGLLLLGTFSACKIESVAEYESRLAEEDSGVLLEELPSGSDEIGQSTSADGANEAEASAVQGAEKATNTGDDSPQNITQENRQGTQGGDNNSGQGVHTENGASLTTVPSEKETDQLPQTISVTISINCASAVGNSNLNSGVTLPADGVILAHSKVTIPQNTSVFDVSKAICAQKKIVFLYQNSVGKYVQKIGPIGEKECGPQSGWTYLINGSTLPVSADGYKKLKNGDTIEWVYVTHV